MKLRSCIVYQFQCQRCKALHLGETNDQLHVRIYDHIGISTYIGNKIAQTGLSSVLTHRKHAGHLISYDDFSVLASGTSQFDVLIREILLVSKLKPSLNNYIRFFRLYFNFTISYLLTPLSSCLSNIQHYFCNR